MPRGFGTCRVGEARWRDDVVEQALTLLGALGYHGIAQTEFRLDPRDGRFKLMEVNPRLWQWHGLARACGVDLPRIAYLDVLGRPQRPVRSGPQHDGRRWVVAAAHLRASRAGGHVAAPRAARDRPGRRGGHVRPARPAAGDRAGERPRDGADRARAAPARPRGRAVITLRPWLDRLLLATLVVTTWHKLHWAPGAGDVTLEDILAAGFVALFIIDRCLRRDWRMHRVALGLLLAMARARGGLPGRLLRARRTRRSSRSTPRA